MAAVYAVVIGMFAYRELGVRDLLPIVGESLAATAPGGAGGETGKGALC